MSAQQNARNSVLSETCLEIATRALIPRTSPTMVSILVLTTAFVAPPVTVHRHRVNELHINALADVNLLIEAAVGIFGAGFAGWKMSQDGKDAEPSAAITAKMPPLDGKVVSSWYDSGMRLTSEAKVMVTSATEATVVTASWYDAGKRLGGEAVSSEPKAIKTPMRNVKTILSKPMPPPGFVWAEDLADAAPATPPAKPVVSWYDSGKRLSSPVTVATRRLPRRSNGRRSAAAAHSTRCADRGRKRLHVSSGLRLRAGSSQASRCSVGTIKVSA